MQTQSTVDAALQTITQRPRLYGHVTADVLLAGVGSFTTADVTCVAWHVGACAIGLSLHAWRACSSWTVSPSNEQIDLWEVDRDEEEVEDASLAVAA